MSLLTFLFLVGSVLLFFEVIVPGGVLGALGGLAFLAGCVVAFLEYGATGALIGLILGSALVGFTFWFEFKVLPRTRFGRKIFLESAIEGTSAARLESDIIGATGVTLTKLSPSGVVRIGNRNYEAFSQSGLLEEGAAVKVVRVETFRIIVTAL